MATAVVIPALFSVMSQFCDVPTKLLFAVAQVESRGHPWTLNINGKGFFYDSRDEQFEVLMSAISEGRTVDIGLMQLNWKWKQAYAHSAWQLTDPTYNLNVACRIIKAHYDDKQDWFEAAAMYHREADRARDVKARARYRKKVYQAWSKL